MARDTETKILDAAYQSFLAQGFKPTTTKQVAQRSGVNESTIFRRYGSKDNLFRRVLEYHVSERLAFSPTSDDNGPLLDGIAEVVEDLLILLTGQVPAFRLLIKGSLMEEDLLRDVDRRLRGLQHGMWQYLTGLRDRGRLRSTDYGPIVELLFGLVQLRAFEISVADAWEEGPVLEAAVRDAAREIAVFIVDRWGLATEGGR